MSSELQEYKAVGGASRFLRFGGLDLHVGGFIIVFWDWDFAVTQIVNRGQKCCNCGSSLRIELQNALLQKFQSQPFIANMAATARTEIFQSWPASSFSPGAYAISTLL